ncbi:helix-turn-helix transcriptional regulator [Streptomyces sp. NPDC006784]|uniref:helix-turn-helix transcriptional regulator n=1 Tax=Streptomyces sp. NPDC006784 TaxID=3364764 RepID=UPI00368D512D
MSRDEVCGIASQLPVAIVEAGGDTLLTADEVSAWTRLTVKSLANARARGTGPAYIKLGEGAQAPVRYRFRDVERWLGAGHRAEAA